MATIDQFESENYLWCGRLYEPDISQLLMSTEINSMQVTTFPTASEGAEMSRK
jgi:hypothetical protein